MSSTCQELAFSTAVSMVVGGLQAVALIAIIAWQWRNLSRAKLAEKDDGGEFRFIITPVYRGILYSFAFTLILFAVGSLVFQTRPTANRANMDAVIFWSIAVFFFHTVVEGIAILLLMKGAGMASLRRGTTIAIVLALIVAGCQALVYRLAVWYPDKDYDLGVQVGTEAALWLFYFTLTAVPQSWLPRRPACLFYAGAWAIYKPVYIALLVLMYYDYDGAYCGYMIFTWIIWGVAKPIIVYWALYLDSLYWQGLYQGMFVTRSRADSTTSVLSSTSDVRRPLLGTSIDHGAASALAEGLDAVHQHCPVINQSLLALDLGKTEGMGMRQVSNVLGAGGTARVFKGRYLHKTVAVKMLYCPTLIKETIDNFFRENELLCQIRHPNIVGVEGVCISPPAVASVMELCRGNLFELLRLDSMRDMDWGTRLAIALDCVRGVACLHRMGYTHRDIKSANFLVGSERVSQWDTRDVALWLRTEGLSAFVSDFESAGVVGSNLGDVRKDGLLELTSQRIQRIVSSRRQRDAAAYGALTRSLVELQRITATHMSQNAVIKLTDLELTDRLDPGADPNESVEPESAGYPQTVNWTAPEVISGGQRRFTKAADVFSCGMLLWEVLTGRVPYEEEGGNTADLIVNQHLRPYLPPDTDPEYAALLQHMWHQEPEQRPTAREVIDTLEGMHRRFIAARDDGDDISMHSTIENDEAMFVNQRFAPDSGARPYLPVSAQSSIAASPHERIRMYPVDSSTLADDSDDNDDSDVNSENKRLLDNHGRRLRRQPQLDLDA